PAKSLNLQLVQILSLCNELRSSDQHIKHIIKTLGLSPQQAPAIKQALEHLVDQGFLIHERDLLAELENNQPNAAKPPPMTHCFIRTADRPSDLERLLATLRSKDPQNGLSVWVLDDSREGANQTKNRDTAERFGEDWSGSCHYIDRDARKSLIERIADHSGADPSQLGWLIEGDPQDPSPTYGAGLNTALLLAAGQRFSMIDDDATLDAFVLEEAHFGIRLQPKRELKTSFIDPEQPETSQYPKTPANPLTAHDQWLGQPLTRILQATSEKNHDLLTRVDANMLHQLKGHPTIRLTTNGTLGDPGTGTMTWLFSQPAKDLNALCHQDPSWANRLFNRRFARGSLGVQISTDFSLMTTTLTGIDNREMLLPTSAQGRNEDLLFAALMHFLYPDSLSVSLPLILPHRPTDPRRWSDQDLDPECTIARGYSHMMVLGDLIESLPLPSGDHRSRMHFLAAWMQHLANLDDQAIRSLLMDYISELQAEQVRAINETAADLDAPEWLKTLFGRVITHLLREDKDAEDHLLVLGHAIQTFAGHYAKALNDWTVAWRWCCQRDMRSELS
ncbi:MAG TPA: hypothetical protein VIC53_08240, partial [Wenzhouxiangella sp.]